MKRTKEEIIAKKAEAVVNKTASEAELRELVSSYNVAVSEGNLDDARILAPKLSEAANKHSYDCRQEFIYDCLCADDPMMEAVKRVYFLSLAVKDNREGMPKGSKDPLCPKTIVDREIRIDLYDLYDEVSIGKDPRWVAMCEKLGYLLAMRVTSEISDSKTRRKRMQELTGFYHLSEAAAALDMGATPTSNTQLLKQLQMIVDATIGEKFKAKSHDVNYLYHCFSGFDNKVSGNVKVSKPQRIRHIILDVLHVIAEGGVYTVSGYKAKKKAK